jgi:hypothetical protein
MSAGKRYVRGRFCFTSLVRFCPGRRCGPGPPAHINPHRHALDTCSPLLPLLHSCTLELLRCFLSIVVSLASPLTAALWIGSLFTCLLCFRGRTKKKKNQIGDHALPQRGTVRSPSPRPRLARLGVTRRLNVIGAALSTLLSTISSVAKLPRVVARTPLTSGRTCGTFLPPGAPAPAVASRTRASGSACGFLSCRLGSCALHALAPRSWILSPSCRAVPAPGVMLSAPLLLPFFSWLGLLWQMTQCLRIPVCALLGLCVSCCWVLSIPVPPRSRF